MTHPMETIPQKYKEGIQEAQSIQSEGDKMFHDFIDKLSIYSGGILSVSLTAILALREKTSFTFCEQNIFFLFILCFIVTLISSIFLKYFSAYQKFVQKSVRLASLEVTLQSIQFDSLTSASLVTKDGDAISSQDIQSNIDKANETLRKLNLKEDYFGVWNSWCIRISIASFITGIIAMTILAFGITHK